MFSLSRQISGAHTRCEYQHLQHWYQLTKWQTAINSIDDNKLFTICRLSIRYFYVLRFKREANNSSSHVHHNSIQLRLSSSSSTSPSFLLLVFQCIYRPLRKGWMFYWVFLPKMRLCRWCQFWCAMLQHSPSFILHPPASTSFHSLHILHF